jgi:hypothetical protein
VGQGVPGGERAQPFHGPDIEYRLSRQYRRPTLFRFVAMAVLTVVCIVTPLAFLDTGAAIFGALAVYFGVSYVWRGRFRTRVTSRGIEARGYFNHFVPWEQVRDIEVNALGSDRVGVDDNFGTTQSARMMGMGGIGGSFVVTTPNTGRRIGRLASISVVRADGHKVLLHAPLVSGWAADPDFDDSARQLHELCVQYGRGAIA